MWFALPGSTVGHLKNDGTYVGTVTLPGTPGITGVAVDRSGKIWAISPYTDTVYSIDPTKGAIGDDGVTPVGGFDRSIFLGSGVGENNGDMTGSTLRAAPTTGTWAIRIDSQVPGNDWSSVFISWDSSVPEGSSLGVTVSSSGDGSVFSASKTVTTGSALNTIPTGRYLKVQVSFQRARSSDGSPVLQELRLGPPTMPFPPLSSPVAMPIPTPPVTKPVLQQSPLVSPVLPPTAAPDFNVIILAIMAVSVISLVAVMYYFWF